jgi:hypothetical protein
MDALSHPGALAIADIADTGRIAKAAILAEIPDAGRAEAGQLVDDLIAVLDGMPEGRRYNDIPADLAAAADGLDAGCGRLLQATLLAQAENRAPRLDLPASVLAEIRLEATRIAAGAMQPGLRDDFLTDDLFLKDLTICRLGAFPCVAQLVEPRQGYSRALLGSGGALQAVRFGRFLVHRFHGVDPR